MNNPETFTERLFSNLFVDVTKEDVYENGNSDAREYLDRWFEKRNFKNAKAIYYRSNWFYLLLNDNSTYAIPYAHTDCRATTFGDIDHLGSILKKDYLHDPESFNEMFGNKHYYLKQSKSKLCFSHLSLHQKINFRYNALDLYSFNKDSIVAYMHINKDRVLPPITQGLYQFPNRTNTHPHFYHHTWYGWPLNKFNYVNNILIF